MKLTLKSVAALRCYVIWLRHSEGILCRGEATRIPKAYKYPRLSIFFPPPVFCAPLHLMLLSGVHFLQISSRPRLLWLPRRPSKPNDTASAPHHEQHLPLRTIRADSSPGRQSGSTTSRFATIHSFRKEVFLPQTHSSTSPSRPEDGRHYMLPRPPEWPRSYESSILTCVSGLAPLCLSEVGGSTSGHGPSTKSISCGRTTVRSIGHYLWKPTSRA